jgi:hypothetical protein
VEAIVFNGSAVNDEQQLADALARQIEELVAQAEYELDRDLTPEERDSLAEEYLAAIEEGEESAPAQEEPPADLEGGEA